MMHLQDPSNWYSRNQLSSAIDNNFEIWKHLVQILLQKIATFSQMQYTVTQISEFATDNLVGSLSGEQIVAIKNKVRSGR